MKGENPSDEQVNELLEACKSFLKIINDILENEMEAWKQEFQAALKQIDKSTAGKK